MPDVSLRLDRSSLAEHGFFGARVVSAPPILAPPLDDDARRLACRAWEDRARSEYVGVMVMRRFHGLLVDLNAPLDVQELALQLTVQEQAHTSLCMSAAASLGSTRSVTFDLDELQQARSEAPLPAIFWDMVCGTFIAGEVVALELIIHSIDALPDSAYRQVLRRIAQDEVLHARIGPALLALIREEQPDWCGYPGDDWIRTCIDRHRAHMRARDVVEPDEAAAFDDPRLANQLRLVGIPPSAAFKAAYMTAVDEAVPALVARTLNPPDAAR